jgi:hypothetical protein
MRNLWWVARRQPSALQKFARIARHRIDATPPRYFAAMILPAAE